MSKKGSTKNVIYSRRYITMATNSRKALRGERMIVVKVSFWTDSIAEGKGMIRPKHALGSGVVRLQRNRAHRIRPQKDLKFNSVMELLAVIERVLIQARVKLHPSRRMKRYVRA